MQYNLGADWEPKKEGKSDAPKINRQQENEFIEKYCDDKNLRFITVPMKVTGCEEKYFDGNWKNMTTDHAPDASAVDL